MMEAQSQPRELMGDGDFVYEPLDEWAIIPDHVEFTEVSAVGVDSKDNVYAFARGTDPVTVFDRDGNFLRTWGRGLFVRPHGVHVGPDDTLWLTDDGSHTVRQFTSDGRMLREIGVPGLPSPYMSCRPFNACTHSALSPQGDIYISDGYGNAAVHKFTPDGRHLFSWGEPGTDPGQFNIPHNIVCDGDGYVYVADRENHRIQIFDGNGKFQDQWVFLHRPNALFLANCGCPLCFVGEGGPNQAVNRRHPNLGACVTILDMKGKRLGRLGGHQVGLGRTEFMSPHGLCVDSRGDIYVAEVSWTTWPRKFPDIPRPPKIRSLRKLRRANTPAKGTA